MRKMWLPFQDVAEIVHLFPLRTEFGKWIFLIYFCECSYLLMSELIFNDYKPKVGLYLASRQNSAT